MNLGLEMSLKLQQKLSFQMIQSLKLLQVNTLQLEQMVRNELEMNPVLEAAEGLEEEQQAEEEKSDDPEVAEDDLKASEDEVDWEEYLEDGFDLGGKVSQEIDPNREHYEPTAVYRPTLEEHLTSQLAEMKISAKQKLLAEFIISSLGPEGYLQVSVDDVAEATNSNPFEVEETLNLVWRMDPVGVGARNLQECLVLQLRAKGYHDSLAMQIVSQTWELFEKVKIPEIARQLNVSNKEVQSALDVLRTLHPKPGYLVNPDSSSVIVPDLIVEKIDDDFVVMLNDRSIPSLHISRAYAEMIKRGSKVKREVKDYVREKLNGATWLIRSIEQRKNTMLKVMYAIIERQRDFFEKGPPNLHPLRLQDIADMVEMHISTVSRVTNGKYVQTAHGIYELKYFFTEGIGRDADGGDVSSERIKNRIRELVENEEPKKPLSDQKISDILSDEDLNVARRTVAKYREQLKILPARLRQKYD